MYTVETAIESLKKFDIKESDIQVWEKELNLDIPVDSYGRKQYSPHHINLFKNIKKHLALGRTLKEIKQIVALPPLVNSQPIKTRRTTYPQPQQTQSASQSQEIQKELTRQPEETAKITKTVPGKSPYASVPKKPVTQNTGSQGAANVVNLVQRLTREKDQLYKKLLETEKLNSHLYSANNLYHRKVKDMTQQIAKLREKMNENENFKLLDDKAKLHKELLTAEKLNQYKEEEIQRHKKNMDELQQQIAQLEKRIQSMTSGFDAGKFCGNWMETGHLVEVAYDNFGINIEPERVRLFRISEQPTRLYGNTAIINTSYQYETNNLWKRNETLSVAWIDESTLEGELVAEYILDGVPVAKALYRVTCRRQ